MTTPWMLVPALLAVVVPLVVEAETWPAPLSVTATTLAALSPTTTSVWPMTKTLTLRLRRSSRASTRSCGRRLERCLDIGGVLPVGRGATGRPAPNRDESPWGGHGRDRATLIHYMRRPAGSKPPRGPVFGKLTEPPAGRELLRQDRLAARHH